MQEGDRKQGVNKCWPNIIIYTYASYPMITISYYNYSRGKYV